MAPATGKTKKTMFSRYFFTCAAVIIATIVLLGTMVMTFASSYFKSENLQILNKNATQAANLTALNYIQNDRQYLDSRAISLSYNVLADTVGADILLVDPEGNCLMCSDGVQSDAQHVIPLNLVNTVVNEGSYNDVSSLGDVYDTGRYVSGVPVALDGQVIAIIFATSSAETLEAFLSDVRIVFIFGSTVLLFIAFVAIFFATEQLIRPLRRMVGVTESFSKGDFTERVPIDGDPEIAKLAVSINEMAMSLADLELTRRSFVANVSHELKTPMTSISGFIDGILDNTIPPERQGHYLKIVSDEVKRLSRLVVSMLNIAKIEAGEMNINLCPVDVCDTILRTVFTFEQKIESKNITIEGLESEKIYVLADPDLLHQVAYNLIENAVKFVNEGGTMTFSFRLEDRGMVTVGVKNSGSGIPKEDIPRLFDRFYKTDKSRSMDTSGVGLGLHIVKSLVHLHGGEVAVRSEEGSFTQFMFSIPACEGGKKAQKTFAQ